MSAIEIQTNREKEFKFSLSASDVDERDLRVYFRIYMGPVNLGFPGKIDDNKARVTVPALDSILRDVPSGSHKACLEIVGNKSYFEAWSGDVALKRAGTIVAQLEETSKTEPELIDAQLVAESKKTPVKKGVTAAQILSEVFSGRSQKIKSEEAQPEFAVEDDLKDVDFDAL